MSFHSSLFTVLYDGTFLYCREPSAIENISAVLWSGLVYCTLVLWIVRHSQNSTSVLWYRNGWSTVLYIAVVVYCAVFQCCTIF